MATPTEALSKLQSDPVNFLRDYHVLVVRAKGQSGPTTYWFGGVGYVHSRGKTFYNRTARPDKILGELWMHDSKNFKFATDRRDLVGSPAQVMAWHVDVVGSDSNAIVGNIVPALAVSRNGGPDIVLTTLLNGCTFACDPTPHSVLMAHVQPKGEGTTGENLHVRIESGGMQLQGSQGLAGKRTFGRINYTANDDVTIIGVRSGTRWRMFAQVHTRNEKDRTRVDEFFSG